MKKRTKLLIIIIVVIVLLIPYRITRYKDGGSVQYNGIFYEVVKYHSFNEDTPGGYNNGLSIKLFGLTLFDNYNWYVFICISFFVINISFISYILLKRGLYGKKWNY